MMELLAPAGDMECLKAAVINGADAVYAGGMQFSARQGAGNLSNDEIIEAVRFCHAYGAKLYIAFNILVRNDEMKKALDYASFLYGAGVDALIVQDLGLAKRIRENYSDFDLHASTQMTVHNIEGVNLFYSLGFKRVVLSRELSLKEIEHISQNTDAEIEVFGHGALCISFSGQCLMSSMIGGRSGNRGRCAQPCRMEYSIDGGKKAYYLSTKDLCTYEFVDKLKSAGVNSLKIEGRMKRPEYVAEVVLAYRNAIDSRTNKKDMENLMQIFNREGFTSDFMFKRQGKDMMSYIRPKNWGTYLGRVTKKSGRFVYIKLDNTLRTNDGVEIISRNIGVPVGSIRVDDRKVNEALKGDTAFIFFDGAKTGDKVYKSLDSRLMYEIKQTYTGKDVRKVPLTCSFICRSGSQAVLKIYMKSGLSAEVKGSVPEKAIKRELDNEIVCEFLNKTGNTPFYFKKIECSIDGGLSLPVSTINEMRREAINNLLDKLQGKREEHDLNFSSTALKSHKNNLNIAVATGMMDAAKWSVDAGCRRIFFGGEKLRVNRGNINELLEYAKGRAEIIPWFPDIIIEDMDYYKDIISNLKRCGIKYALSDNAGINAILERENIKPILGKGFNIFNSDSCRALENLGCVMSPELNFEQIKDAVNKTECETYVEAYGKIKLMVSRQCIIGSAAGYGRDGCPNFCKGNVHYMKDRVGENIPVYTDKNCMSHIYSSKTLCLINEFEKLKDINPDYLLLRFIDEDKNEVFETINAFKECIEHGKITDDAEKYIEKRKNKITCGHFDMGVI